MLNETDSLNVVSPLAVSVPRAAAMIGVNGHASRTISPISSHSIKSSGLQTRGSPLRAWDLANTKPASTDTAFLDGQALTSAERDQCALHPSDPQHFFVELFKLRLC